ncbi:putative ent-kaurene synthase [Helianthus annuus]|nr:putative ent-kaurene synthase [Helianthus annuus]KAJ0606465.1 putative ent-kaurene synthase [Helianthus annuus]KAJ0772460.1 putative ent-kaurene synthase [Helianthus annuus]KAJ0933777.1 putative ent-kaurene synthase [Helianthus annuus]
MVMKYQMKNGSILNSPSASAASVIYHPNSGCHQYLTSLLQKFGNAVPTIYPLDLYARLYMVDQLERLGISQHFMVEIRAVLDQAYSYWMQKDEKIFMNAGTCALAFRLLREYGYQISSGIFHVHRYKEPLAKIIKEGSYMSSHEEPFEDTHAAFEAYLASQIIYQDELPFGELNLLSADFLKREISAMPNMLSKHLYKQVLSPFEFGTRNHFV